MHLSIVIPAYNAASGLEATLQLLAHELDSSKLNAEVVVVDDGSADDTSSVVARAREHLPRLAYVHRARDAASCRSRARNLGVRATSGDSILFLDAGVLPSPEFVEKVSQFSASQPDSVAVCKLIGLFAPALEHFDASQATRLPKRLAALLQDPDWEDPREPYFRAALATPHRLPAAWLFAWTAALLAPRAAVLAVGGFDESYLGWGVEDIDLAARLEQSGLSIRWLEEAIAIHVPHRRATERSNQHAQNALQLHAKLCTRETELFAFCLDAFSVNLMAARLDLLDLAILAPGEPVVQNTASIRGRVLCVGLVWTESLGDLRPEAAIVHERTLIPHLRAWWPRARIECLVGLILPFEDAQFDLALLGDFIRLLPEAMRRRQLRELRRVAKSLLLDLSWGTTARSGYMDIAGWPWAPIEEIARDAAAVGLLTESVEYSPRGRIQLRLRSRA